MWLRRIGVAAGDVDRRRGQLAGRDRALDDARRVAPQVGQGERRVEDLGRAGLGADRAAVADLAAALGVERRAVEEDLDEPLRSTSAALAAGTRQHGTSAVSST